jgi:hypothetical protein
MHRIPPGSRKRERSISKARTIGKRPAVTTAKPLRNLLHSVISADEYGHKPRATLGGGCQSIRSGPQFAATEILGESSGGSQLALYPMRAQRKLPCTKARQEQGSNMQRSGGFRVGLGMPSPQAQRKPTGFLRRSSSRVESFGRAWPMIASSAKLRSGCYSGFCIRC